MLSDLSFSLKKRKELKNSREEEGRPPVSGQIWSRLDVAIAWTGFAEMETMKRMVWGYNWR